MALIECSTCGHMVSDKGMMCPRCGTPILQTKEVVPPIQEIAEESNNRSSNSKKYIFIALCVVAIFLLVGLGFYLFSDSNSEKSVPLDHHAAWSFDELLKQAQNGDADAQYKVGMCYEYGDGVGQDEAKAMRWYGLAAGMGHVEAQQALERHVEFLDRHGKKYADSMGNTGVDDYSPWDWEADEYGFQNEIGDTYEDEPEVTENPRTVSPVNSTQEDDESNDVMPIAESMPEFPGGYDALNAYLIKNIKYPTGAQEYNAQGRVLVEFVVNTDGSIVDAKVVRSVDSLLDKEALRVVSAMPKWEPGMQHGKPVRSRYTIPVMFRLQ